MKKDLENEFLKLNENGMPEYSEEIKRGMLAQVANLILNGKGIRGYWNKEYIVDEMQLGDPFDSMPINIGHIGEYMKIELIGRIDYFDPRNIPVELVPPFDKVKEKAEKLEKKKKLKQKLEEKDERITVLTAALLAIGQEIEEDGYTDLEKIKSYIEAADVK